jgi:hypothetical protein
MEKKTYQQPIARVVALTAVVTAGPVVSYQFDKRAHMPLGVDDGEDEFMSREWDDDDYWDEDEE